MKERLARGDPGINELDRACLEHDKAYASSTDTEIRREADKKLASQAWERAKSWDSGIAERGAALAVAAAMKAKSKIGGGVVKKPRYKVGGKLTPFAIATLIRHALGKGLYLHPFKAKGGGGRVKKNRKQQKKKKRKNTQKKQ